MTAETAKSQMMLELAHAMAALACDDHDQLLGIITAVHTRLVKNNAQGTLPGIQAPEPPASNEARRESVIRLFSYWQARCDHKTAKLTPERGRAIVARLRDGYTEAEIRKAIDGASVAAFVNEDNGHRYDDLTLICRNGSKLESFMERGVKATGDVVVAVGESSPIDEQITAVRREMATMRKDGRQTEYDHKAAELSKLMARRKTS